MSMDRSLKTKGSLSRHRNVLTRGERIEILKSEERFDPEEDRPLGLPKVAHRKVPIGGKTKKVEKLGDEAESAETPEADKAKDKA